MFWFSYSISEDKLVGLKSQYKVWYSLFNIAIGHGLKGKRKVCNFCFSEISNNGCRKLDHIVICKKKEDDIKFKRIGEYTRRKLQKHYVGYICIILIAEYWI